MRKYSKHLLAVIIFFLCSKIVISQNQFNGTVVEEDTARVVDDAIVAIEGTALAKTTNEFGEFNFLNTIPNGEHVVTVTKKGYETKFFLIEAKNNSKIAIEKIEIIVNKDERNRRAKEKKAKEKEAKKIEKANKKKLEDAQKEKEKRDKILEKEKKKLLKEKKKKRKKKEENLEDFITEDKTVPTEVNSQLQEKFSNLLGIPANEITNTTLYEFIDEWLGTNYKLGGANKDGIDCSSFTQRLYTTVYDLYIERTADKQFNSKLTDKFQGKEFLREGDLIFFKGSGENSNIISHVGIYLHNNMFVHATSYFKDTATKGVKISNLKDGFWKRKFVAGGRRVNN